jgi:capsular polysaccharide biosynthesis protein/Mrp family chromosome partitioning ATPase
VTEGRHRPPALLAPGQSGSSPSTTLVAMSWRSIRPSSLALRSWVIFLASVAGALCAYAYGLRVTPVYEAKAILLVNAPEGVQPETAAAQVPTYAELVNSTPLLRAALDTLKLPLTPSELQPNVRGEADTSTRLLTIRVRSQDPAVAEAIANTLTDKLIRRVAAAAPRADGSSQVNGPRLTILQPASGGALIRPRHSLIVGFGALAGLFGGLAVVVIASSAQRTVRREDELARLAPIPVLGSVNGSLGNAPSGGPMLMAGGSGAETYRRLSARILSAHGERAPRSLLVVGASGNEGSAAFAGKLAVALAGAMGRVALTDLASGRPIAPLFGIDEKSAGASAKKSSSLRYGARTLDRYALRTGPQLVLGFPRGRGGWSGGLDEARAVLALLLADADFVVVHAVSLGSSSAPLVWARITDAAVLVVRPAETRRESVVSAVEALGLAGTDVVGTVLYRGRV